MLYNIISTFNYASWMLILHFTYFNKIHVVLSRQLNWVKNGICSCHNCVIGRCLAVHSYLLFLCPLKTATLLQSDPRQIHKVITQKISCVDIYIDILLRSISHSFSPGINLSLCATACEYLQKYHCTARRE